jgi:hypothetical protein
LQIGLAKAMIKSNNKLIFYCWEIGWRMAAEQLKRSVGRPRGTSERQAVTFKLPKDHYAYLRYLVVEKKRLGISVNDAARFILIRELDAMFNDGYHAKEIPAE